MHSAHSGVDALLWLLVPWLGVAVAAVTLSRAASPAGTPAPHRRRWPVTVVASAVFGGLWVGLSLLAESQIVSDVGLSEPGFPTVHFGFRRLMLVQSATLMIIATIAATVLALLLSQPRTRIRSSVLLGLPLALVTGPLLGVPVALAAFDHIEVVSDEGPQQITAEIEVDPQGADVAGELQACVRDSGATQLQAPHQAGSYYTLVFRATSGQQTAFDDCTSMLDGIQSVS